MSGLTEHALEFVPPVLDGEFGEVGIASYCLNGHEIWIEGTLYIVKHLRSNGVDIRYLDSADNHPETALRSQSIILPAIVFTAQAVAAGAISVFIDTAWKSIRSHKQPVRELKISYMIQGETEWLHAVGPPETVLNALELAAGGSQRDALSSESDA